MTITYIILMLIPIVAICIFDKINCWRRKHAHTFYENLFDIFLWIIIILSAFLSYFAFQVNIFYGIAHYIFPLLLSLLMFFDDLFPEVNIQLKLRKPLMSLVLITAIMFVAIVPIAVLPTIASPIPQSLSQKISAEPIIANLDNVKKSIESLQTQLIEQSKNIDSLSQSLITEIDKKNIELQNVNREQQKVLFDLQYYKSMASLSEEQANAILTSLNRSKYIDYLVGFLIGLFSSGIFYILQRGPWRKHRIDSRTIQQ